MKKIIGGNCSVESMFGIMDGWTSHFEKDGKNLGGTMMLHTIPTLLWQIKALGGVRGKRVLELGPLEGSQTKKLIDEGASEVIAIEGLSYCFVKCLIVKEAFHLDKAKFIFGDFCSYVQGYTGKKFDFVLASGVLYHQTHPARLIYDLADITDVVAVWSQVADAKHPSDKEIIDTVNEKEYRGKMMHWGNMRAEVNTYCASLDDYGFWMYAEEMRRCFVDAGFVNIFEETQCDTTNGACVLFIASK